MLVRQSISRVSEFEALFRGKATWQIHKALQSKTGLGSPVGTWYSSTGRTKTMLEDMQIERCWYTLEIHIGHESSFHKARYLRVLVFKRKYIHGFFVYILFLISTDIDLDVSLIFLSRSLPYPHRTKKSLSIERVLSAF
ncbi:hypothetical protein M0804_000883 [Polistes exclamans]|nr:hypothetical protein M0804_000883 [Polistes exclamans]